MRNSFTVRLAAKLTLMALGIPPGVLLEMLTAVFSFFLGAALDKKIIPKIDVTLDGLREGKKISEFKKQAALEFARASKLALTEDEKDAIRNDFRRTLEPVVRIGGLRDEIT